MTSHASVVLTKPQLVYAAVMDQRVATDQKPRVKRPRGRTPISAIRLSPELTEAVKAWIADQPDPKPSRSVAVRLALRDWLTGLGYLLHRDDPEMAN